MCVRFVRNDLKDWNICDDIIRLILGNGSFDVTLSGVGSGLVGVIISWLIEGILLFYFG